jgi:surface polysaccharide O-acyltransferase-like enzyme
MEQQKSISHFLAGVIMGAIMIIYSLMLNFLGKGQDRTLGWIAYLLFVAGIIIFVNLYGNAKKNEVTFGNLFSYGFKTTALATLLILVCLVVIIFAMPDFKQKILDGMRKGLEDRGTMTDEQIDNSVEVFSKNFTLFIVGGATFMYLLFGVIGSLIGAAITKKKPINPLDQMSV